MADNYLLRINSAGGSKVEMNAPFFGWQWQISKGLKGTSFTTGRIERYFIHRHVKFLL